MMKFSGAVCLLMSLGAADVAVAADPFYIGNWTLTAAAVAPWADPQRKPDSTGQARLMGKEAAFKARDIRTSSLCLRKAAVQGQRSRRYAELMPLLDAGG
jgi:hypothetical protein